VVLTIGCPLRCIDVASQTMVLQLEGLCANMRPNENARVGISYILQQCGGRSKSSNQTLKPKACFLELTAGVQRKNM
jgi:hypothetical protein